MSSVSYRLNILIMNYYHLFRHSAMRYIVQTALPLLSCTACWPNAPPPTTAWRRMPPWDKDSIAIYSPWRRWLSREEETFRASLRIMNTRTWTIRFLVQALCPHLPWWLEASGQSSLMVSVLGKTYLSLHFFIFVQLGTYKFFQCCQFLAFYLSC